MVSRSTDSVSQHDILRLYSKKDTESFEYFIENKIAVLKNYILDIVVTPSEGTQNVHVQNFWKYELREKLGIKVEYKARMGTFEQDMFGGHPGNVLDAFYTKFTPKYVIGKLEEEINERGRRLNDAGAYMSDRLKDEEYAKRVFLFESEEEAASHTEEDHWRGRRGYTSKDGDIGKKSTEEKYNMEGTTRALSSRIFS